MVWERGSIAFVITESAVQHSGKQCVVAITTGHSLDLPPPRVHILKVITCWGVAKVEFTRLVRSYVHNDHSPSGCNLHEFVV